MSEALREDRDTTGRRKREVALPTREWRGGERAESRRKNDERYGRGNGSSIARATTDGGKGGGRGSLKRATNGLVDALCNPLDVVLIETGHRDTTVAGHVDVAVVDHDFALGGCGGREVSSGWEEKGRGGRGRGGKDERLRPVKVNIYE